MIPGDFFTKKIRLTDTENKLTVVEGEEGRGGKIIYFYS